MAIVWDKISTAHFLRLTGEMEVTQDELEEITRTGSDGVAFRKLGKRATPTTLFGEAQTASVADIGTLMSTLQAMQATTVTVVKGRISFPGCLILRVFGFSHRATAKAVGGVFSDGTPATSGANWILRCGFDVQRT